MKVKDKVKELLKLDQELECYVYADHGQTTIKSYCVSEAYIHKDDLKENYVEEIHPDDIKEYDIDELVKICVISG